VSLGLREEAEAHPKPSEKETAAISLQNLPSPLNENELY